MRFYSRVRFIFSSLNITLDSELKINLLINVGNQWATLTQSNVPIEICPTSNLLTLNLRSLDSHHTIESLLRLGHPFSLCTDDRGVFRTTLTKEYVKTARAYNLSEAQTLQLAQKSFQYAFCAIERNMAKPSSQASAL